MTIPPVTINTRRRGRAYTDIPPELRLHLEQEGLRPSWQVIGTVSSMYPEGIEVVSHELLPAELREALKRMRFVPNADGNYVSGTVVLCTQPVHMYEEAQADYQLMALARQQRTDVDELDAAVREQLGLGGVRNPPGILHPSGHGFRPGDFVQHTPAPSPTDDK